MASRAATTKNCAKRSSTRQPLRSKWLVLVVVEDLRAARESETVSIEPFEGADPAASLLQAGPELGGG